MKIFDNFELRGTTLFSKSMPNFCIPHAMLVFKIKNKNAFGTFIFARKRSNFVTPR